MRFYLVYFFNVAGLLCQGYPMLDAGTSDDDALWVGSVRLQKACSLPDRECA